MRIKFIPKDQQGGVVSSLFTVYTPTPYTNPNAATAAKKTAAESDNNDLTDKDLLKMLGNLDGLPSDMQLLTSQLQQFYLRPKGLGSSALNTNNIASRYTSILNQMKVANFNKKEYDNAYSRLDKNGGLEELAINDRGQFVCTNKDGDFQLLTAEQLKDLNGEYQALTNNELLRMRAYNENCAFDDNITQMARNGIGMQNVTDYIQNALNNLGSSEHSESGYEKTLKGRLAEGLEVFEAAVKEAAQNPKFNGTVHDLYKYKYVTKDQANQAQAALQYIYQTMPENMRALLKSKSDLTDEGAFGLLSKLIASKTSDSVNFDLDFVSPNVYRRSGDDTDLKDTNLVAMISGVGGNDAKIDLDPGTGIKLSARGKSFGAIDVSSGKSVQGGTISNLMAATNILGTQKSGVKVQFGDKLIDNDDLDKIVYGNGNIVRVELPINEITGQVDLDKLGEWQKLEDDLNRLSEDDRKDPQKVWQIYHEHEFDDYLDPNTLNGNTRKTGIFLVTGGCYTTNRLLPSAGWDDNSSGFVYELGHDAAKTQAKFIEDQLNANIKKGQNKYMIDTQQYLNPMDWGLGTGANYEHIYRGCVFIPVDTSLINAAIGDRQKLDFDEANTIEWNNQLNNKRPDLRPISASALNNNN